MNVVNPTKYFGDAVVDYAVLKNECHRPPEWKVNVVQHAHVCVHDVGLKYKDLMYI